MSKSPLPIGSHGKITTEPTDETRKHWLARTPFKDADGVTRSVRDRLVMSPRVRVG